MTARRDPHHHTSQPWTTTLLHTLAISATLTAAALLALALYGHADRRVCDSLASNNDPRWYQWCSPSDSPPSPAELTWVAP